MSLLFSGGGGAPSMPAKRDLPAKAKKTIKSVNAKRKKIRRANQIVNYVTGNSLIDWLMDHPDEVNVTLRPLKIKTTYKTPTELFLEKMESTASKLNLTCKRLQSSNYGCETILAMRDKLDVILNCTLADRSTGYMTKVEALVMSTVINRLGAERGTKTEATSGFYIPVCFGTDAETSITIALNILLKYQNVKPDFGFTAGSSGEVGKGLPLLTVFEPSAVHYAAVDEAINGLNDMDELTSEDIIGANGHIDSSSPWCLAIKTHAFEQENITMLPNVHCVSPLEWSTIEEYEGSRQAEWVDNYYSITGKNMPLFKELFQNVKLVHRCTLDGIVYQVAVHDTVTGEGAYQLTDHFETGGLGSAELEELGVTDNCVSWEDMKNILVKNDIKFPYTCNYDLDFICMRTLSVQDQAKVPVVNFSVEEVAREYYYGSSDKETKAELASYLEKACKRDLIIMDLLIKMSRM